MATSKISYTKEWIKVAEVTQSANSDIDQTVPWSVSVIPSEVMLTCQRVSNGRVFATAICPYPKWMGGGLYAYGSWATDGSNPRCAVAIDATTGTEFASTTSSEAIKYQFYVR